MDRSRAFGRVAALLLAFGLTFVTGYAQTETGRITGTVSDSSGKQIAEVAIVAKSMSTGAVRKTKSSDGGKFTISNLRPGAYEVTFTAPGMESSMSQVRVAIGSSSRLDVTMYPLEPGE